MSVFSKLQSILSDNPFGADGADVATHVVSALIGNATLSAYSTAAQTAVRAVVTELDNGVDSLRAAFDKFESTNPLVQNACSVGISLVRSQGLAVPTEDDFVTHVKAAIADLASAMGVSGSGSAAGTTTAAPASSASDPSLAATIGGEATDTAAATDPAQPATSTAAPAAS